MNIGKNHQYYETVKFLHLSVGRDSGRPPLYQRVKIENGRGAATDGARLHAQYDLEIPDGVYRLTKEGSLFVLTLDESRLQFPEVDMVLPKEPPELVEFSTDFKKKIAKKDLESHVVSGTLWEIQWANIDPKTGLFPMFDARLLCDALTGGATHFTAHEAEGHYKPCTLYDSDKPVAVVMPLRPVRMRKIVEAMSK